MAIGYSFDFGIFVTALVHNYRTAVGESATNRQVMKWWWLAFNGEQPVYNPVHPRHGGEEGLRVGVGWFIEDVSHTAVLNYAAGIHHCNPVTHLGDDAEVVGDEND